MLFTWKMPSWRKSDVLGVREITIFFGHALYEGPKGPGYEYGIDKVTLIWEFNQTGDINL